MKSEISLVYHHDGANSYSPANDTEENPDDKDKQRSLKHGIVL